jgi:hypothetical protein
LVRKPIAAFGRYELIAAVFAGWWFVWRRLPADDGVFSVAFWIWTRKQIHDLVLTGWGALSRKSEACFRALLPEGRFYGDSS